MIKESRVNGNVKKRLGEKNKLMKDWLKKCE